MNIYNRMVIVRRNIIWSTIDAVDERDFQTVYETDDWHKYIYTIERNTIYQVQ